MQETHAQVPRQQDLTVDAAPSGLMAQDLKKDARTYAHMLKEAVPTALYTCVHTQVHKKLYVPYLYPVWYSLYHLGIIYTCILCVF